MGEPNWKNRTTWTADNLDVQVLRGEDGGTSAGTDPANVLDAGSADRARIDTGRPRACADVGTVALGPDEVGAACEEGRASRLLRQEFPHWRKSFWCRHLWARGSFWATVGAVNERTVREYLEGQKWGDDMERFKITAPESP